MKLKSMSLAILLILVGTLSACAEKDKMPDIGASCLLRCVVLFVCHSWQFNPCLSENILDESGTVKSVRGSPAEYIWNSL